MCAHNFSGRKCYQGYDFLISVKNCHDNWNKMAGFPFRSPTFNCCFNKIDTSTLKLFPISLADFRRIGSICTLEGIYNNIFIEGNTSVRLWSCGLKGIALVSLGSFIPSRHCYNECNFNILNHSCGSTIVRGFLMIIVLD